MSYQIEFTIEPFDAQREILNSTARFRVVCAGRRFGKSMTASLDLLRFALDPSNAGSDCMVVGPTYSATDVVWGKLNELLPEAIVTNRKRTQPREIELVNGSTISLRSADHPDTLRGNAVDRMVVDEAAFMDLAEVFPSILRPMLADTQGGVMLISTPARSREHFYELYLRGQDDEWPAWESWQLPTEANPHVAEAEIESARRSSPDRQFRREWLAEFVDDDAAAVFSTDALDGVFQSYDYEALAQEGRVEPPVSIGLDLGRANDYTVITALDGSGTLVGFKRMRRTSWSAVEEAARAMYAHFDTAYAERAEREAALPDGVFLDDRGTGSRAHSHSAASPTIYADGTRDSPLIENLRDEIGDHAVESVKFTASSKKTLIERLSSKVDHGELTLPDSLDVLRSEMEAFETQVNASTGNVSYDVRVGHDDTVDSLALAASGSTVSQKSKTKTSRFIFVDDDEPVGGWRGERYDPRSSSYGSWRS